MKDMLDVAVSVCKPYEVHSEHATIDAFVIPDGYTIARINNEQYQDKPVQRRGEVQHESLNSFISHAKREYYPHETTFWIDADDSKIVAVFDDNYSQNIVKGENETYERVPRWRQHRSTLLLKRTDEWKHWTLHDSKGMEQEAFAEHIEDGLDDIVEPSGAQMLEIAQSFHATIGGAFRQAKRLKDGSSQLLYTEEVTATAGSEGSLTIPSEIKLGLSPFKGMPRFAVTARLRYRVSGGKLSLSYKLDRPDKIIDLAIEGMRATLGETFGAENVFIGEAGNSAFGDVRC